MAKKRKERKPRGPRKERKPRRRRGSNIIKIKVDVNNREERRRGQLVTPVSCVPREPGEPVWITAALATCCPVCKETVKGEVIGHDKDANAWLHRECHPWTLTHGSRRVRSARARVVREERPRRVPTQPRPRQIEMEDEENSDDSSTLAEENDSPRTRSEPRMDKDCEEKVCAPRLPGKPREARIDPKILSVLKHVMVTRCPYCHSMIDSEKDDYITCANCLARHHRPCWFATHQDNKNETGQCCICGSQAYSTVKAA